MGSPPRPLAGQRSEECGDICFEQQMGMLFLGCQKEQLQRAGYQEKREVKEGKRGRAGGQDRHRGDRCCRDRCCVAKLGQGMAAGRGQAFCCAAPGGLAAAMGLVGRQPSRRPPADGVAAKRSHPVVLGVAGSSCKKQTALLTHGMPGRAGTPAPSHLHPARAPARSRCPPPSMAPGGTSQGRECTPVALSLWAPTAAPTWTESSPSSSGRMR